MTQVTASVTIGFASGADASSTFSAEVDSRENGLNAGTTSFAPGASVHLLLYKTNMITMGSPVAPSGWIASSGVLSNAGLVDVVVEEDVAVGYDDNFSLAKPVKANTPVTLTWYGPPSGGATFTQVAGDQQLFKSTIKSVAAGKAKYTTEAVHWVLSGANPAYPAVVLVFFGDDGKIK